MMIVSVSVLDHYLGGYLSPIVQLILYPLLGVCVYSIAIVMLKRELLTEVRQIFRIRK